MLKSEIISRNCPRLLESSMSGEIQELVNELSTNMDEILRQPNLDAGTVRVCHAVNRLLMLIKGE